MHFINKMSINKAGYGAGSESESESRFRSRSGGENSQDLAKKSGFDRKTQIRIWWWKFWGSGKRSGFDRTRIRIFNTGGGGCSGHQWITRPSWESDTWPNLLVLAQFFTCFTFCFLPFLPNYSIFAFVFHLYPYTCYDDRYSILIFKA